MTKQTNSPNEPWISMAWNLGLCSCHFHLPSDGKDQENTAETLDITWRFPKNGRPAILGIQQVTQLHSFVTFHSQLRLVLGTRLICHSAKWCWKVIYDSLLGSDILALSRVQTWKNISKINTTYHYCINADLAYNILYIQYHLTILQEDSFIIVKSKY